MANIKDFAAGIVVTPPSPATTGTSITLRAGDGGTFPPVPFYVTATPPGNLTTLGTSEKLLVTAVSGDTFTITRAQSPTTAKSITAGWIIANAIYTADVTSSNIVMDEVLTGTINGSNTVFTTSNPFSSILVFKNGITLHAGAGNDYTITGQNQITFATAPQVTTPATVLTATYIMGSSVMINGSNSLITDETPSGAVNGSNTSFTTSRPYVPGSLEVFVNGVKQKRVTHFTETSPSTGAFTISDAPQSSTQGNDDVMVNYQYVVTVTGNADTVDGYHASTTAASGIIPVADSNGKISGAFTGENYSTTEALTGGTWIDGKPIYKQTFSVSTTASGNEQIFNIGLSTSTTRIIKVEGGSGSMDYYPIEYINPNATTLQNMQLKISYVSGTGWQIRCNSGAAQTLIITIYFVK